MKKLLTICLLLVTLFISQNGFSQSNKISFALFGGYSIPTGDLKGDIYFSGYSNNSYLVKSGFNLGGAARYNLDRKGSFQLVASLMYNAFSNSADTSLPGYTMSEKYKINILSFNVGGQYNFKPNQQINPYVNFAVTNNFISGSVETSGSVFTTSSNLKSAYRTGLQFGAGIEYAVSDQIGIIGGANYNLANLIGKSNDSLGFDPSTFSLNDAEHTFGGTTIASRSISFIQLYAGISIYLNRSVSR